MIVAAFIIPIMAGFSLTSLILHKQRVPAAELLAHSFLLGELVIGLSLFFPAVLGIPAGYSIRMINVITVGVFAVAAIRFYRSAKREGPWDPLMPSDVVLVGCIGLYILIALIRNTVRPDLSYDGFAIYAPKAKAIFLEFSFDFVLHDLPHPDYPPLLPLTESWNALMSGVWNERLVMMHIPFFMIAGTILLYSVLRLRLKRTFSLAASLIFIGTPEIFLLGKNAICDLPLGMYLLGGVICLYKGVVENRQDYILLAAFHFTGAAWLKNEGLPLSVVALTAFFIMLLSRSFTGMTDRFRTFFTAAACFLLLVIPWWIFKSVMGLKNEFYLIAGYSGQEWSEHFARLPHILFYFMTEMITGKSWIYFTGAWLSGWLFFMVANLLSIFRKLPVSFRFIQLICWLHILLYVLVFFITPYDVDYQLRTALDRTLAQIFPGILLFTFLVFGEMLVTRSSRGTGIG